MQKRQLIWSFISHTSTIHLVDLIMNVKHNDFSYIQHVVAVSFNGGENQSVNTQRKPQ